MNTYCNIRTKQEVDSLVRIIRIDTKEELFKKMFEHSSPISCGMCDDNGCYCQHGFPGSCGNGSESFEHQVVIIGDVGEDYIRGKYGNDRNVWVVFVYTGDEEVVIERLKNYNVKEVVVIP